MSSQELAQDTAPDGSTQTAGAPRPAPAQALRSGAIAVAVSLVVNLAGLLLGRVAGADMAVTRPGQANPTQVGAAAVALSTIGPLVLGALALLVVRRPRAWRALAWTGLAIGVLTLVMPLSVQAAAGTKLVLATMHLVVGATWLVAVSRALTGHALRSPQGTGARR